MWHLEEEKDVEQLREVTEGEESYYKHTLYKHTLHTISIHFIHTLFKRHNFRIIRFSGTNIVQVALKGKYNLKIDVLTKGHRARTVHCIIRESNGHVH